MSKNRRSFLTAGTAGAATAATLGFPMIARAQQAINWKMTSAYPKGAPFYMDGPGSATDLAKRIEAMSNGRLKISVYGAGELIPALEGFDAVRAGTVEMNHANSYFWTGKTFAAQYFTAVPFGLNFQGMNGWLYDGGGQALWNEVYAPFGMVAFPCGNTGVQMTGWFKKEIKSVADFKGLKMRIPGLAGKVYASLGVDVKLLPGGEIFPALERGVIDAAEFVGPYQDRRLGLQKAAKNYYTTGWHETATVSELLINKAAWEKLPKDLQAIVENASAACNVISEGWCQRTNAEAMEDLVKNQGVIARPLPDDVVKALREATAKVLAEGIKDPLTKKVHDSYMAYMAKYKSWAAYSEAVYHDKILGVVIDRVERFIDWVGRATSWLALAIVVLMATNVVLRYLFSYGSVWSQELEWHLLAPLILFAIAWGMQKGEHVRVDVAYTHFSARNKQLVNIVSAVLCLAISVLVVWLSVKYVQQSYVIDEKSADPGGLTHRWVLKALIPLGFVLLALQSVAEIVKSVALWRVAKR